MSFCASLLPWLCSGLVLLLVAVGVLLWLHGRDCARLRAKAELAEVIGQIENLDAAMRDWRRFFGH